MPGATERLRKTLRQSTQVLFSTSGLLFLVGLLAAFWAIVGLPAARVMGAFAVLVTAGFVVQKVAFLSATTRRLEEKVKKLEADNRSLRARIDDRYKRAGERITKANARIDANRRRVDRATTLARETGAVLRAEITGMRHEDKDWQPVDVEGVPSPILSVAIPGFNRPEALWNTLESLCEQIEPDFTDRVEIVITDDCSVDKMATEVAHRFAVDHQYIGFRRNETNLGLERNLIRCAEPCRGTYLWVFGNDDLLGPDALATIIEDLDTDQYDLVVVDKDRMGKYGGSIEFRPGNRPIDLPEGEAHVFDSMLHIGEHTGLISTFGWITQVIRRREPYMSVDAEPFFNTSLHPHLGMMLVAFPRSRVLFRAIVGVIHRTQDPRERLAESAGRPEVAYMAGGMERDSRWFGAGYAAMLQRVVDRSEISAEELLTQREELWTDLSLLDWIAKNWQHGIDNDLAMPSDVLEDAARLFESLDLSIPTTSS